MPPSLCGFPGNIFLNEHRHHPLEEDGGKQAANESDCQCHDDEIASNRVLRGLVMMMMMKSGRECVREM